MTFAREKTLWTMLIVLLLTCTTIRGIGIGTASSEDLPVVSVEPTTNTALVDETFTIDIAVANISQEESLYGWEIGLSFDPKILRCTQVLEGPFLKSIGTTSWSLMPPSINNIAGTVAASDTFFPFPSQGKTGSGVLCNITFQVEAEGSSLLHFYKTVLRTYNGTAILEIEHTVEDGYFGTLPVANFTYFPLTPHTGENVTFNATASYDPDGYIVSYVWDFGDDTTGTGNVTTHSYDASGTYTVTLTVTDNQSLTDTATAGITVLPPPVHDIAVINVVAPIEVTVGELVPISVEVANEGTVNETFGVTFSYDNVTIGTKSVTNLAAGVSTTVKFNWDTRYLTTGEYVVNVTVPVDNDLADNFKTTTIKLKPHVFLITVDGLEFNVVVDSNSSVSNFQLIPEIKEMRFDVTGPSGKVGFCNVTIPISLFGGPYIVQVNGLLITPEKTTNGTHSFLYFTYDHSTHKVTIKGATVATPPIASFNFSTTDKYAGDPIIFNASTSRDPDGSIISYKWDFGDGTPIVTETDPITTHVYTGAGTYPVNLTVTDNQSLTDTATDRLVISGKHDVAVVNVTPSLNKVKVGKLVSINVTVVNQGTEAETFNVTVYYDNVTIGKKSVTNLDSGESETLTFNWETANVDPDAYTIKAVASSVEGEMNVTNNEFIDGTVTVQEAPALSILLYVAAAGVAAITMVAVAFYFLRIRKPKPA